MDTPIHRGEGIHEELFTVFYLLKKEILGFHAIAETGELSRLHLGALGAISRGEGMNVSELARSLHVSKPQMTAILDRLADLSLVTRQGSKEDRRVVMVAITGEGRRVLDESMARVKASLSTKLAVLSADERAGLAASIHALAAILRKL